MKLDFIVFVYEYFEKLISIHGFIKRNELIDDQSYFIEYSSSIFVIKLEKYRKEFYATLYKLDDPDNKVNLFNLLQYLNKSSLKAPESNYFHEENNINECYRKQLRYISGIIYENFVEINIFFYLHFFTRILN